ncbi:MAG: TonB-dependent receptor, partial [Acidobacteria bacterium]
MITKSCGGWIGAHLLLALFVALGCMSVTSAQVETGQISGTVLDPEQKVIPGAEISVKGLETGLLRTTLSNDEGVYTVSNLQPGVYEVTVEAPGFGKQSQKAQLTVGSRMGLNFSMKLQEVAEQVTVLGSEGVKVETLTQTLSSVVSQQQIKELPTLTRNPYDLVSLSGNVTPDTSTNVRGTGYNINGQRSASTNIMLDGSDNNDLYFANVGMSVPIDSVQEFSVITSNFSAEFGRATGGIVNAITKSGGNSFHGSLFEYNRVSKLSSNSYDNNANEVEKGIFTRNQFGYSVGGPIKRDKLFFFSSTEWIRVRSFSPSITLVPTPELLAASSKATQDFFKSYSLETPINGRIYKKSEVSGVNAAGAFAALPAELPAFGQVIMNEPTDAGGGYPQNHYQSLHRIDWNISENTTLYGRHAIQSIDYLLGTQSFSPWKGFNTGTKSFNNSSLLSLTRVLSPTLVSQSKVSFNRLSNEQPLGDQPAGPTLYFFRNTAAYVNNYLVALPGYLPFNPGVAIPAGGPQNLGQLFEDVSWNKGKHDIRLGASYLYIRDNHTFGAYQNAVETLGANRGQALDNLVLGNLIQFDAAIDPKGAYPGDTITLPVGAPDFSRSNRYHEAFFYLNDSWRIRTGLNLNLGLRYEYYGVQHNKLAEKDSNFYYGSG